jgi:hypothetical protein
VEIALVVVVEFVDGKISAERIYWDHAGVLAQIGLLDKERSLTTGIETARRSWIRLGSP